MPIKRCSTKDGGKGWKWGNEGTCYPTRAEAVKQAEAAYANGYTGDAAIVFAFDRSMRRVDQDGRLHVALTNISKATVNPYYGREIPGASDLGLKADEVYQVFRDPDALEKGAATFNNIPLLDEHIIVSADDPKKSSVVGSLGTDAVFDGEYLKNSLVVWDAEAIRRIESGEQKEISSAYRYVAVLEAGTHKGLPYQVKMKSIVANHAALVKEGRAGPDVVVADGAFGDRFMKFSAIKGKLAAKFATDSAFKADRSYLFLALDEMEEEVDAEDEMEETEAEEKAKEKAEDKKAKDKAAKDKAAKDKRAKDKAAKDKAAKDKKAKDEEEDPEVTAKDPDDQDEDAEKAEDKKGMDKAGMDAAIRTGIAAAVAAERAKWDALAKAKADVAPLVGDVHGMDEAAKVYKFALDSKGVTPPKTNDLDVLSQMVGMIGTANTNSPRVALDSKSRNSVADILPALGRYA